MSNRRGIRAARRAAILAALGAALLVVPVVGAHAAEPAVITPTGNVTITVSNAFFTLTVTGAPQDVGPFSGTLTGTVDDSGNLTIPKSGIDFPAFDAVIVVPATVHPVATADWTGTVDPSSGVVTITGTMETLATVSALSLTDCPVGPFTIHTSTVNSGGAKYASGKATVSDPSYPVSAIPAGTSGCNGAEETVNTALGLPGTGGIRMGLSFDPVLTGSGVVPTSTSTTPTTPTMAAAPATTAAPAATTLPRTGSSTLPLAIVGVASVAAGAVLVRKRRNTA
jgi:LPXTG-motif cell wall-anchored protein